MEFFRSNVIVSLLLLGLLVFMQYRLWCGSGGIIDMMHLKKQLAVEQARNDVLKKRNQTEKSMKKKLFTLLMGFR